MRFQNVEISLDNRRFLDTVLTLSKKNDELTRTINYQIIDERYRNLDEYLFVDFIAEWNRYNDLSLNVYTK